ncbi:MlaC/ttg2D family ABC transporter substrate-binding protein [Candidatus Pelagibacter sp. Uisw_134_02]|jgi:phospholipid transport system substrate-binding protein|uniref:MlaC/ttg2D family ABC transporter substrate-binding protein n=1 Tax=Candidatus Pelagibacter sp. Uisw_134_02 TaxID=3230990 RepID=UPI0039E8BDF1|tara:strand:- start:373 stop:966 length:594 start_codon:yes stop_codon:yes gene_type:complete
MKKIFTLITFLIIFISSITKTYSIEADIFVQSTVNRAAKTLGGTLSKEERIKKLKEIARDTVDIDAIGFYSLGAYRKKLNEEQIEKYKEIFSEYFLKSFSSRLAEYSNPEIEVNSKKIINENYTIVTSTLVATESRPEVKIQWRVYTKNPDNLLIRDLIIEGLSLARTQKEEFASIINSNDGNIEALFKNLSDFVIR